MDGTDLFITASGLPVADAALVYADAGVAVFPCAPGGKRPLTRHGFVDATIDLQQVSRWWTRWPDANVGLPTGNAVDVIDVDCRPTGSGFAALERARRAGLTDGWALIVRTPSRGLHLYYPADPDRPQPSWAMMKAHVDFRGAGGYVIAAPSQVTRSTGSAGYALIATGRDPHPVDGQALHAFLRPPQPRPRPAASARAGGRVAGQGIAEWLAGRPEGTRNNALFWAACRYAEADIPHDHAHRTLGEAAQTAGLPQREVTATIRSAYRTATPTSRPIISTRNEGIGR